MIITIDKIDLKCYPSLRLIGILIGEGFDETFRAKAMNEALADISAKAEKLKATHIFNTKFEVDSATSKYYCTCYGTAYDIADKVQNSASERKADI